MLSGFIPRLAKGIRLLQLSSLFKKMLRFSVQLELQWEYWCFLLSFGAQSSMTATHSLYLLIFTFVSFLLIFTVASTVELIKNVHFWKLSSHKIGLNIYYFVSFFHLWSLGNEKCLCRLDYNVLVMYACRYLYKIHIRYILYEYIV